MSEKNEIDVGSNHDVSACEQAEYLLLRYKPMKTKSTEVTLSITLKENKPIYSRPRRLPAPEREIVEMQLNEWVKNGIFEPCSSEFASPVVVTERKDDTPRVCIDYRGINSSN